MDIAPPFLTNPPTQVNFTEEDDVEKRQGHFYELEEITGVANSDVGNNSSYINSTSIWRTVPDRQLLQEYKPEEYLELISIVTHSIVIQL